jgi:hypothetical protein
MDASEEVLAALSDYRDHLDWVAGDAAIEAFGRMTAGPKTVSYEVMALLVAASRTAMDAECYFCESDALATLKANGYTVTK